MVAGTAVLQLKQLAISRTDLFYVRKCMSATPTTEGDMVEVYSLVNDAEHIRKVQRATLKTTDYGLVPEHGLFGTADWWEAIRSGQLPIIRIEGVISRVRMGNMNDWPVFEIDASGCKTTWPREVHRSEDDRLYTVGKRVCLEYVIQNAKKDLANFGTTRQQVILRIVVER